MRKSTHIVPVEKIEGKILLFRDKKVLLDRDLAVLYGVKPIVLRQQVKRNIERFPDDFMFRLDQEETELLVSQNVIPSKRSLGGSLPYVFTGQGVAMLSSVLRSDRAVQVNIQIMRTFSRLREMIMSHKDLQRKIAAMERKYDSQFKNIFEAFKQFLEPPKEPRKKIGFKAK